MGVWRAGIAFCLPCLPHWARRHLAVRYRSLPFWERPSTQAVWLAWLTTAESQPAKSQVALINAITTSYTNKSEVVFPDCWCLGCLHLHTLYGLLAAWDFCHIYSVQRGYSLHTTFSPLFPCAAPLFTPAICRHYSKYGLVWKSLFDAFNQWTYKYLSIWRNSPF